MIRRVGRVLSIVGCLWLRVAGRGVVLTVAVVVGLHSGLHEIQMGPRPRWGGAGKRRDAVWDIGFGVGVCEALQRAGLGGERGRSWARPGYSEARGDLASSGSYTYSNHEWLPSESPRKASRHAHDPDVVRASSAELEGKRRLRGVIRGYAR